MISSRCLRVSAMLPAAFLGTGGSWGTAALLPNSVLLGVMRRALSTCMDGATASASQAKFCFLLFFREAFPATSPASPCISALAYTLP